MNPSFAWQKFTYPDGTQRRLGFRMLTLVPAPHTRLVRPREMWILGVPVCLN